MLCNCIPLVIFVVIIPGSRSPRCSAPTRSGRTVSAVTGKGFQQVFCPTVLLILFYTAEFALERHNAEMPRTNYKIFSL
jgi:hypothetical protein